VCVLWSVSGVSHVVLQVKELGLLATDCPCLGSDVEKIFDVYWQLSHSGTPSIPDNWPANLSTTLNLNHPARLRVNKTDANVYLAVSKLLCVRLINVSRLLVISSRTLSNRQNRGY